jgi:hypothetical protein
MTLPKSLAVVLNFVISVSLAIFGFLVIAGGAVVISVCTKYVSDGNLVSTYISYGLDGLEYVIFAADIIGFVVYIAVECINTVRAALSLLKH